MPYSDTRYGGVKRWYSDPPEDEGMRFLDEFKRNVCFLCVQYPNGDWHIGGTAFLLYEPYATDPARNHIFVVTARHNIEMARAQGYETLYLRINTVNGGADYYRINKERWVFPVKSDYFYVDAAVALIDPIPYPFDTLALTTELCVTAETIRSRYIGIGEELHIFGLFKMREGVRKNIPILRSATLAAMPEEEIPEAVENEDGEDEIRYFHAYLVEVRSIKGLSGSPVYLWIPPPRAIVESDGSRIPGKGTTSPEFYILGLVRGHWSIDVLDTLVDYAEESEDDRINTGIATVTPITEVLAIMNGSEMLKKREEKEKEHVKGRTASQDSGFGSLMTKDEGEITQDAFEEALRRASRKIPPDEEKSE